MAYEKYIKKDGKLYGPYIYHSRRVDGKVVSEYHGQKKIEYGKFLWIIPAAILIILGAYFIGQRGSELTGHSVLDLNANYQPGSPLAGEVKLSLQEGELIPASSMVVFENNGKKYEYNLNDVISEQSTEGNFFMKEKNISGSGLGFGIPGTRGVFPEVQFILNIEEPDINDSNAVKVTEVEGSVSAGNAFTYALQENERAEIKLRSVRTSSGQLSENDVTLAVEGNMASVLTNYSEEEKGFGPDFFGNKVRELSINLNSLNIVPERGILRLGILYEGEEIVSMQTTVGEGDVSSESEIIAPAAPQIPETIANETFNEPESTAVIPVINYTTELTAEERAVIEKEFGNISLQIKEEKTKNGFILIKYELGDYWISYSYDENLSESELQRLMETDKTKWLKDLAARY